MKQLHWIAPEDPADAFPQVRHALHHPPGLLAAGGDLSPSRLLAAYRRGIFPWYESGQPILWWCPDPRAVLVPEQFHVSRSLMRTLRRQHYTTTIDADFDAVVAGCAAERPGQRGTWITPAMATAYHELHRLGFAHSVEAWRGETLAGGLYGISIGTMFFAESMFSHETDASKVALHSLTSLLQAWEFPLIDCQVASAHLATLGMTLMPRERFVHQVAGLCSRKAPPGAWRTKVI